MTDTHGHVLNVAYNSTTGTVKSVTDSLGRTWGYTVNPTTDLLTATTDPDGHVTQYAYDSDDDLTQITDPNGNLTEITYDSYQLPTSIRRVVNGTATTQGSKDAVQSFAYFQGTWDCPTGSTAEGSTFVTDPDGNQTVYCYDANDQVVATKNAAGNLISNQYNSAGLESQYQNPGDTSGTLNLNTTAAYDASSAPTQIIQEVAAGTPVGVGNSLTSNLTYASGCLTPAITYSPLCAEPGAVQTPNTSTTQTGNAHTTYYNYNSTNGNLNSVDQGSSSGTPSVSLTYNSQGQVLTSTDADGNVTHYTYGTSGATKGDLLTITPPATAAPSADAPTTITYDGIDRIATVDDGKGITAAYTYDGEDRVKKIAYSDGSSVSFVYDPDGNTTSVTDATIFGSTFQGTTAYQYDPINRPTLETFPDGKMNTYTYDPVGNLLTLTDAGGAVSYAYNALNQLKSETEPNGAKAFSFAYDTDGDRTQTDYPSGLISCSTFDAAQRETSLATFPSSAGSCASPPSTASDLQSYGLTYTIAPSTGTAQTALVQTLADNKLGRTITYNYSPLDQIASTSSSPAGYTYAYSYDNAGNITHNSGLGKYYKYNAANEICAIATTAPTACGTIAGAGTPAYDADGDLTGDGASPTPSTFAYDARDQLDNVTPGGGSAVQITDHGSSQIDLASINNQEVDENILGVGSTGSGSNYYTLDSGGALLAERNSTSTPSATQYVLPDPFGSVAALTNSTGTQTAPASGTYQYDPYGNPIGTASSTFGYLGAQIMPTGLLHFGQRYYDPSTGAWTQRDPINQVSSLTQSDAYGYVGDDPVNEVDPAGQAGFPPLSGQCVSNPTFAAKNAKFCRPYLGTGDICEAFEDTEASVGVVGIFVTPLGVADAVAGAGTAAACS